jgi:hypothetical protein
VRRPALMKTTPEPVVAVFQHVSPGEGGGGVPVHRRRRRRLSDRRHRRAQLDLLPVQGSTLNSHLDPCPGRKRAQLGQDARLVIFGTWTSSK